MYKVKKITKGLDGKIKKIYLYDKEDSGKFKTDDEIEKDLRSGIINPYTGAGLFDKGYPIIIGYDEEEIKRMLGRGNDIEGIRLSPNGDLLISDNIDITFTKEDCRRIIEIWLIKNKYKGFIRFASSGLNGKPTNTVDTYSSKMRRTPLVLCVTNTDFTYNNNKSYKENKDRYLKECKDYVPDFLKEPGIFYREPAIAGLIELVRSGENDIYEFSRMEYMLPVIPDKEQELTIKQIKRVMRLIGK